MAPSHVKLMLGMIRCCLSRSTKVLAAAASTASRVANLLVQFNPPLVEPIHKTVTQLLTGLVLIIATYLFLQQPVVGHPDFEWNL